MTSTTTTPTSVGRQTRQALWIGLWLQVLVTLLPAADRLLFGSTDAHVRDVYPQWGDDLVAADRDAVLGTLGVVGVLGLIGWLVALRVTRGGGGRITVTVLFVLGALTAITLASIGGEPYDRIVPLWLGLTGLLPSLAGLTAVLAIWRGRG